MQSILLIILWTLAIAVALPLVIFAVECFAALLPFTQTPKPHENSSTEPSPRPRLAILIPAHNEESVLPATLRAILPQLLAGDKLIVIADNCDDTTASLAAQAGATVLERRDDERRGKGYALAYGLDSLRSYPPEIVLLLDADATVSPGAIDQLARTAKSLNAPVQGIYTMESPPHPTPKDLLSALAFLVKNQVRPRGLHRLGLPCLLTGTGMAFPYAILESTSLATANIVEDMQLGIDLALLGHPPRLCPRAHLRGTLPPPAIQP